MIERSKLANSPGAEKTSSGLLLAHRERKEFDNIKILARGEHVETCTTALSAPFWNYALARADFAALCSLGLSANGHSGATGLTSTVAP